MLEALDGFMILLDRKRQILFVSRNVEEHLGLSQVWIKKRGNQVCLID